MSRRVLYSLTLLALLIVGCEIPSQAPIENISRVDGFFWRPLPDSTIYDVYETLNPEPIRHALWIDPYNDGYIAHDRSNNQTGIIVTRVNESEVAITDIIGSSLFLLPDGAYIAKSAEEQIKYFYPIDAISFEGARGVAFSSEGSFVMSGQTWQKSLKPTEGIITAVGKRFDGVLYVGSSTGAVYQSIDVGLNWSLMLDPGGRAIKGIVLVDTNVFIAVEGTGVFVSRSGGQFEKLGVTSLPGSVTGIALVERSKDYNFNELIVTTDDAGIWYGALNGSYWAKRPQAGLEPGTVLTNVYRHGAHSSYLATAKGGVFLTSLDTGASWTQFVLSPLLQGEDISSAVIGESGRIVIGTTHGNLFETEIDGSSVRKLVQVADSVSSLAFNREELFVAGKKGISRVFEGTLTEDLGPFEMRIDTSRGDFVLLQSEGFELQVTDNWLAGYLFTPQIQQRVPITARVTERIDTLQALGESFSDVVGVRYAFEPSPNEPMLGSTIWMIYYARDIGPVLIDQMVYFVGTSDIAKRAIYRRRQ